MAVAQDLVNKIFSLVDLQKDCANKFNNLADKLEENRKAVNKKQVFGSSLSVLGSAAVMTAGFCTGGIAIPVLAAGGAIGTWLGFGISVASEAEDAVKSYSAMKDAEKCNILEKIQDLEKEIHELMESLAEEGVKAGGCSDAAPEDYVLEQIMRQIAKRNRLRLNHHGSMLEMVSVCLKERCSFNASPVKTPFPNLLSQIASSVYLPVWYATAKKTGKEVLYHSVPSTASAAQKGALKVATSTGKKASGKALKFLAGGTVVFSSAELIYNCFKLKNCETDTSKSLKETAKAMLTTSEEMDKMKQAIEMLAEVKRCIENSNRCSEQKQKLIKYAIKHCEDEAIKKWLRENSKSKVFFKLVDMFYFLQQELDKAEEKIDCREDLHITFVAHGSIEASMIPASFLLPLPSITDVLLYSPWNCSINAAVAYGVATGRIRPQHRRFYCRPNKGCQIPNERHQPTNLPRCWNSMKKAGGQKIPNILVSPLRKPEDGAWERFLFLTDTYGQPERNRIVVPFILPELISSSVRVPFSVITLALSLVLFFSRYRATVHLAACLGRSAGTTLNEDDLKAQYACTVDHTAMTASEDLVVHRDSELYRAFEAVFG